MKKTGKIYKNTAKNIALVLLILLTGIMMLLNWGASLQQAGIVPSFGGKSGLFLGDGGYERRAGDAPAAYPIRMCMTNADGKQIGIAYNDSTVSSFYAEIAPLFASALEQTDKFLPVEEKELLTALQVEDTVMMQYSVDMPLQLLKGWLNSKRVPDLPMQAEMMLLTHSGDLFVRSMQDGTLYTAKVQVEDAEWKKASKVVVGTKVMYAGLDTTLAYRGLFAESAITGAPARCDVLKSAVPKLGDPSDASSLKALLEAFDYSAYARFDTANDGKTQMFVENFSTLEVARNGKVHFRATAMTGGLSAYQEKDDDTIDPLVAQVDFSQQLLTSVLRAIGSTSGTTLQRVQLQEDGTRVLQFSQMVNGIPVRMGSGRTFATFQFQKGVLISAELWLRNYTVTGEKLYVMPEKQAAASIMDGQLHQYQIIYLDNDETRVLAAANL